MNILEGNMFVNLATGTIKNFRIRIRKVGVSFLLEDIQENRHMFNSHALSLYHIQNGSDIKYEDVAYIPCTLEVLS